MTNYVTFDQNQNSLIKKLNKHSLLIMIGSRITNTEVFSYWTCKNKSEIVLIKSAETNVIFPRKEVFSTPRMQII